MDKISTRLLLYLPFLIIFLTGDSKAGIHSWGATTISFKKEILFENRPAGTLAGTLSVTSDNMLNGFTYTLVPGAGDCSNDLFEISGNKVRTVAPLNYEERKTYCIRVRATAQNGKTTEKSFSIEVSDVNEQPTLAAIGDQNTCFTDAPQFLTLQDVSAGPEEKQKVTFAVETSNGDLFDQLEISPSGTLVYKIRPAKSGQALITVTVKDNGGTENEGDDTFSQSFNLTVSPPPVIAITSNRGNPVSKGLTIELTATGGTSYRWIDAEGAISGLQSATLIARPGKNSIYRVQATSAAGCISEQVIEIQVKDDYLTLVPTNILTPNGDGKNDRLVVKNIDLYPNNEIRIFDKAGRMLFTRKNYKDEWDGYFQGSILEEGPYFYVIDFGNNNPKFKGHVTIIRD